MPRLGDGVYYLAVHDAGTDASTLNVTYQWIYKYAVLAWDVHEVGNQGMTSITFQGNGLDLLSSVELINYNGDTISAMGIKHISSVQIVATFDFNQRDTGWYNLNSVFEDEMIYSANAIHVVLYEEGAFFATLIKNDKTNQTETEFTLRVVNTGNTTAYRTPIYLYMDAPYGGEIEKPILSFEHNMANGVRRNDILPAIDRKILDSTMSDSAYEYLCEQIMDYCGHDAYFVQCEIPAEYRPDKTTGDI